MILMAGLIKTGVPSPSSEFWQRSVKEKFNRVGWHEGS